MNLVVKGLAEEAALKLFQHLLNTPESEWSGYDKNFVAQMFKALQKELNKGDEDFSSATNEDLMEALITDD